MKAIVMCGGFAKRLEPLSEFIAKPLLTLKGRPLLDYILQDLEKIEVIDEVVVSANQKFENQFRYLAELKTRAGYKKKITLVIEPTSSNETKFGAIKGLNYAVEQAGINDGFFVVAGDNFYTFDIKSLFEEMAANKVPSIVSYDVKSLDSAKRFGVLKVGKDTYVESFEEKPEHPMSSLVSTGIYFYSKDVIKILRDYVDGKNNVDSMGNFVRYLTEKTKVKAFVQSSGNWVDIGTLDSYKRLFYEMQ